MDGREQSPTTDEDRRVQRSRRAFLLSSSAAILAGVCHAPVGATPPPPPRSRPAPLSQSVIVEFVALLRTLPEWPEEGQPLPDWTDALRLAAVAQRMAPSDLRAALALIDPLQPAKPGSEPTPALAALAKRREFRSLGFVFLELVFDAQGEAARSVRASVIARYGGEPIAELRLQGDEASGVLVWRDGKPQYTRYRPVGGRGFTGRAIALLDYFDRHINGKAPFREGLPSIDDLLSQVPEGAGVAGLIAALSKSLEAAEP